ncbi:MAG: 50S ribosomal protein L32 [Chloroflexota bacterium]
MGALPKRKISKGRRNRRRAHDALSPIELVTCPNCGEKKRPHRVCHSCGEYQGRKIFDVEE